MRISSCSFLFQLIVVAGCASAPRVALRVPSDVAARSWDAPAVQAARKSLDDARAPIAKLESELAQAQAMAKAAVSGPVEVVAARHARLQAEVAWRTARLALQKAQVASADALVEQAQAELAERAGAEIEAARFRGQRARLEREVYRLRAELAARHAERDARERELAEAKERYASGLRAEAR